MKSKVDCRPLIEAPMESPLNLAHTFSRRADMLAKNRKYEEAITCHRQAADYLLKAMEATPSPALQESMSLQHRSYLSEITRLQHKNQLLQLMDHTTRASAVISQASQTDSISSMNCQQAPSDEDTVYEILRENEECMRRLRIHDYEGNGNTLAGSDDRFEKINDDKFELIGLNKKLSLTVVGLLKELEATRAEKRQIEEKLGESGDSFNEEELKFYSLDVPPLEVSYPELAMLKME